MLGIGALAQDLLSQLTTTVVGGFVATQSGGTPSLTINIGAGRIYQFAVADAATAGSISQDNTVIVQQGQNIGQSITLTAPPSGQSQWNLIQCQFSQLDAVRSGDPNGGIVPFYNAANPAQPTTQSVSTVRQGLAVLQVITGASATTGSEVPPTPTSGWVPLYLIDLAGGQTAIITSQILVAGPSVGTGVSANYPSAPFIGGLLGSHHGGTNGQAPKIKLGSEVQGILPYANMSPVRTLLNANLVLYVNPNTGADTNQGLTPATAFRTIQAAINVAYQNYDYNGFIPIINLANGTYTTGALIAASPVGMSLIGSMKIVGNTASPTSVIVSTTNAACFLASSGANLNISGMTLASAGTATASSGFGIYASAASVINFSFMNFGTCASAHMVGSASGQVVFDSSVSSAYTISGSSPTHLRADAGGLVGGGSAVVTLTGSPNFSSGFAVATRAAVVQAIATSYNGAATGPRYLVSQNGVITTNSAANANYFPGSTAGTANTGGQYS